MSTTPDTTVVVVEERRRRFPVPLVAAVAAVALMGSATFALWTTSQTLTGGTITAGNLDLGRVSTAAFYDVSADRADKGTTPIVTGTSVVGHGITTPADWRIVPGDTVAVVYTVNVTLEGDNMVAALSIDETDAGSLLNTDMTYSYAVYIPGSPTATVVVPKTVLGGSALAYLAAPDAGQAAGASDAVAPVYGMTSTTQTFTVVVYGEFDHDAVTDPEDNRTVVDTLGGLALTLTQVRTPGVGQFAP